MFRFDCCWDEAGIGNVLPEENECVSRSFDVVVRLLFINIGLERATKRSYLSGVALFGFGSRYTPLHLVNVHLTVVRAGRGVCSFSSDQVTP